MREDFENRDNDEIVIDLREVFGILKRKFKTVLGITAVFLAVAGAYAFFWPKTYESTALLRVRQPRSATRSDMMHTTNEIVDKDVKISAQRTNSYARILTSYGVVNPLIPLVEEPNPDGKYPGYEGFVKDRIKTEMNRDSDVIEVSVFGKTPEEAQMLNQKLLENFKEHLRQVAKQSEDDMRKYIAGRTDETTSTLQVAREKLDALRARNKYISPVVLADRVAGRLSELGKKREDNALAIRKLEIRLMEVNDRLDNLEPLEIRNSAIDGYYGRLAKLEHTKREYEAKYTSKHPVMLDLLEEIKIVQESLAAEQEKVAKRLVPGSSSVQNGLIGKKYELERELVRRRNDEQYWAALVAEDEVKIKELLEQKREYQRAEEEETIIKSHNALFLKKLEELKVAENNAANAVDVVDNPSLDEKPVSPKKARTLAIALVLGLICGSMYVVVKEKA